MLEKMASQVFDYLVLGGGSGGIASARRAAQYGAKVGLVEKARLGGTCVNVGCVPKKVMWNTASIAEAMHEAGAYGFDLQSQPSFNWKALKAKRDAYIKRLNGIYANNLAKDGIQVIEGTAAFVDNNTIKVGEKTYTAKHILIACGSRAFIPEAPGSHYGVTSDGFFELEFLPKKVAIVGAGYIAVELAGIFSTLGAKVSLLIRKGEVLRTFDSCIRDGVMQSLKEMGVEVLDHSSIKSVVNHKGENVNASVSPLDLSITIENKAMNAESTLSGYESLIYAVGREAYVEPLALQNTSITLNDKGYIITDEYQHTAVESILALGIMN